MPRETPINKVLISQKEDWRMKILGQLNVYKRAPHYVEVIELVKSTLDIQNAEGERNALIELYHFLANAIHQENEYPEEVRDNLNIIEELCRYKIDRNDDIGKQLRMLAEMICKSYMGTDNSDLMMLSFDSNIILKKAWYQETEWKNFETMKLPVPKFYHEVLTAWYGNYMTPVQGAAQHDDPFYKKQMKLMEQNMALKKYGIDIFEITKEE